MLGCLGNSFGLSAAAATESNMLFGKVLGWGFVLPALLQIVSPGTSSASPSSFLRRWRRRKGRRGSCQADFDSEPHTCEGHMHKPRYAVGTQAGERAHTYMHTDTCTPEALTSESSSSAPTSMVWGTQLGWVQRNSNAVWRCHLWSPEHAEEEVLRFRNLRCSGIECCAGSHSARAQISLSPGAPKSAHWNVPEMWVVVLGQGSHPGSVM